MFHIINYNSGELEISDYLGHSARLSREQAYRLVMAARMHGVDSFIEKLPILLPEENLVAMFCGLFQKAEKNNRWTLKEKIARLYTVSAGIEVDNPNSVTEVVKLG